MTLVLGRDLTLVGLSPHLRGESIGDPEAREATPEARDFLARSSVVWRAALGAAGASSSEAGTVVANTTKFYVPEPSSPGDRSEAD